MYKALIVDDEKMIRMGIKNVIPWESLEITQVFTAASAKEALLILNQHKIDIMITDINMSEMTGLELIKAAKINHFDIKIIVLTGYDDFEYARECLRMRVEEFFLKPVDEDVLTLAIEKQILFLKNKKEKESSEILKYRTQGASEQLALEKNMKNFINNAFTDKQLSDFYLKYNYDKDQILQIAIIIPELDIGSGYSEQMFTTLSIKNISMSMIDAEGYGITFNDHCGRIVMAFLGSNSTEKITERISELHDILKVEYNINLKVAIGNTVVGFNNLRFSYNDALYLLNNENADTYDIIQSKQTQDRANLFKEIYQELKVKIRMNIDNMEYVLTAFDQFTKTTKQYHLTVNDVRRYCFEIASSTYFAYVSNSGESANRNLTDLLKLIIGANEEEACEVTRLFLLNILGKEQTSSHDVISKAKRYINEHLTDELSLCVSIVVR